MSDLSIDKVEFLVIKDEDNLYPDGCNQFLTCKHTWVGTEDIITANYIPPLNDECINGFDPAGTVPYDATDATQVLCSKILVPGRGFIWINDENYQTQKNKCSGCCVS